MSEEHLNDPPAGTRPSYPLPGSGPAAPPPAPSPPVPPQEPERKWLSGFFSNFFWFLMAPLIAIFLAAFVIQSYQVDGQSMETALQNRDRLIVNKVPRTWARVTHHAYVPKRGDIIVFNQAGLDFNSLKEKQLIKRVIGLPGDRVVVNNGKITLYDKARPNGFNPDKTGLYTIAAPVTPGDVDLTLGSGEIFVCGDNRTNSEDSRYFGPVNTNKIVGKLSFRIIPIDKVQHY